MVALLSTCGSRELPAKVACFGLRLAIFAGFLDVTPGQPTASVRTREQAPRFAVLCYSYSCWAVR